MTKIQYIVGGIVGVLFLILFYFLGSLIDQVNKLKSDRTMEYLNTVVDPTTKLTGFDFEVYKSVQNVQSVLSKQPISNPNNIMLDATAFFATSTK